LSNLGSALALEKLLTATNRESYEEHLQYICKSCYKEDLSLLQLQKQITTVLVDVIKHGTPLVKKVNSIQTVCDAMNAQSLYKTMLSEVHKLLRLYLTIPISLSTSERTFSALKQVLTY